MDSRPSAREQELRRLEDQLCSLRFRRWWQFREMIRAMGEVWERIREVEEQMDILLERRNRLLRENYS